MSLEKEIEDIFRSNANDIMIEYNHYHFKRNYKRLYNVIEKTVEDFATQQTEKLSAELEQTKEKLKRCEEVIDMFASIMANKNLCAQSRIKLMEYNYSQLKDNG